MEAHGQDFRCNFADVRYGAAYRPSAGLDYGLVCGFFLQNCRTRVGHSRSAGNSSHRSETDRTQDGQRLP